MRVTPVREVYTVQALAKPRVALRVIRVPGYVHIALDIKRRHREWLQHKTRTSKRRKEVTWVPLGKPLKPENSLPYGMWGASLNVFVEPFIE